jgi:hypothetical protein
MTSMANLGKFIIDIKYIGILARHDLSKVILALSERSFPFHPGILFMICPQWVGCPLFKFVIM